MARDASKPRRTWLGRLGVALMTILALAGCAAAPVAAGSGPVGSTAAVPSKRSAHSATSPSPSSAVSRSAVPNSTSPSPTTGPHAIEDTTWQLVRAIIDGKTYDSPQPPGSSVYSSYTVLFAKGRLEANDACNTLDTTAAIQAETVTVSGDVRQTLVACGSGSGLRAVYDRELFRGSLAWAVTGGRLTLTAAGDTFEFEPLPAGYPSDLAGVKHVTTAEHLVDGVRFRIYAQSSRGGGQCLTMEFNAPAGTPWEPLWACRDNLAAQYVVNPTDFSSGLLPSGTGYLFSAVPNGSASRIVFRPTRGGAPIILTQVPLSGTKFQAFYGFIQHPDGGGTVTFYDAKGKPYSEVWTVSL